jgi:hypothetical protein
MKVENANSSKLVKNEQKKSSSDEIRAKLAKKFGQKVLPKKKTEVKDKAEIHSKGVKNSSEEDFGDIKSNDPSSQVTHNKLKEILKTGAFDFNDKERKALSQILK